MNKKNTGNTTNDNIKDVVKATDSKTKEETSEKRNLLLMMNLRKTISKVKLIKDLKRTIPKVKLVMSEMNLLTKTKPMSQSPMQTLIKIQLLIN